MRPLALFAFALAACSTPPPAAAPGTFTPSGAVVLKVNGNVEVTQDMVDAVIHLMPEDELDRRKKSGAYAKMVEQIGLGEVLYRRALEQKLDEDPVVQRAVHMKAREVLAQEYMHRQMLSRVTDQAIEQFYNDRAVQYMKPQARARHILVKEEAAARQILEQLTQGGDFAALAHEHTIDARTKEEGGDLGWFARDKLAEEVAAVAFDGALNKPTVIETRFGFHVIEPTGRRDGIPLDEARAEIEPQIRQREYEAVLEEARAGISYERFGEVAEIHNRTDPWGVTGAPPGTQPPHPHPH